MRVKLLKMFEWGLKDDFQSTPLNRERASSWTSSSQLLKGIAITDTQIQRSEPSDEEGATL